jgi:hypothetical protein
MHIMQSRRDFLSTLSAAGAAGVFGARTPRAGEAPPETSTVMIGGDPPGICIAPQYMAEDLLRAEGFTEIRYLSAPGSVALLEMISNGEVNFGIVFVLSSIVEMEAGHPLTLVAHSFRLLRAVRPRRDRQHQRLEGEECRRAPHTVGTALLEAGAHRRHEAIPHAAQPVQLGMDRRWVLGTGEQRRSGAGGAA